MYIKGVYALYEYHKINASDSGSKAELIRMLADEVVSEDRRYSRVTFFKEILSFFVFMNALSFAWM